MSKLERSSHARLALGKQVAKIIMMITIHYEQPYSHTHRYRLSNNEIMIHRFHRYASALVQALV